MELKPGYKQTEVGVIPEDWGVISLGDLGKVVRGGSPRPAGDPKFFDGDYVPWLTVAALTNIPEHQLAVHETESKLTEEGSKRSRTLQAGTLIIANSGATLGVAKLSGIKCCANDGVAAIIDQHTGDKSFICHCINAQTKRLREAIATGNGQPNLNTGLIKDIIIPWPPQAEQAAIAECIADVDALLLSLEQVLAKKYMLKEAAMQELLTGKRRLSGFEGGWEVKRLGEVAEVKKGQLITSSTLMLGDIPVIAGGKKPAYFHSSANRFGRTITISASGASAGYVALYDEPIYASDCTTISESKSYSIDFIYFHLLCKQQTIYKAQTGGAQPHIHAKDLNPIMFSFPALYEQVAIAAVLSEIEAEVAVLESRRNKICALKQGMMQELLTGRIRLA